MKKFKTREVTGYIEIPIEEIVVTIALFLLLAIPAALAEQPPIDMNPHGTPQPAVPVAQQTPAKTSVALTDLNTSVDFLMPASPVSQSPVALLPPVTQPVPDTTAVPTPLLPTGTTEEDVAVLVSEQCKQSGDEADGSVSCSRIYSNGHHTKVLSQSANEGDEFKQQAVIEEFDKDGNLISTKSVRHRVDYNYLNDQKAKERELFDITSRSTGGKTSRELMVYQYFLNTGRPKTLSWTQYKQIGNEPKAALTYHASLRYGADGSPERGVAEQWDRGQKTATFLDWSRLDGGFIGHNRETWSQWENWIQNVSLQAYLP